MFTSGDLAIYFGFASELTDIQDKNPNLNFDVAPIPQLSETSNKTTYGSMIGVAILKTAKNIGVTYEAVRSLSDQKRVNLLSESLKLFPARRDLLSIRQTDRFSPVFYQSALQSKSWFDPDSNSTDKIFRDMIVSLSSKKNLPSSTAVDEARAKIRSILK
jgi:ABC-type glycerol-3-phosphate transport system substrate-binding protein